MIVGYMQQPMLFFWPWGKTDNRVFCNARMRAHLAECLKSNYVTEFPVEDCKRRGRMGKEHVIEI
jgi:hypothetical protein